MAHKCTAIMFHCIDFRLIGETRRWMREEGLLGDCDVVSVAGAAKQIADGSPEVRDFLLNQIRIARDLHHVSRVILAHHSSCGAYKASYNFATPEEESKKQSEDMAAAGRIIQDRFPGIEVVNIWVQMLDDSGHKAEFRKI